MLALENYSKHYNEVLLLKIGSLTFEKGVYWIKGENGSGKTSLFKSIAGILPFEGDIQFSDGISLKKNPILYRKRISYSEAEPLYPGFLTAKDIVRFTGKIKGASQKQQEEYSDVFGISEFINKPCETYSSGVMKKLALTLTFLGESQLIILDEPLITLDENTRAVLFEQVQMKLEKGVIFLISSHQSIAPQDLVLEATMMIVDKSIHRT